MTISIGTPIVEALGANGGALSSFNSTGCSGIAVAVSYYQSGPTPTLSDNKSNSSWSGKTIRGPEGGVGLEMLRWFFHEAPNVGTGHVITVNGTGIYASAAVYPIIGGHATAAYEAESGALFPFNNTSAAPGSITPAGAGRLFLVACSQADAVTSPSVDSGFTLDTVATYGAADHFGIYPAHFIDTGTTAKNPAISWTESLTSVIGMITVIPAAGGGGGGAVKTINGVAVANIKTINGIAIANVKTFNGVTL